MPLKEELRAREGVIKEVFVFSKNETLVKTVSDALRQSTKKGGTRNHAVVHRNSVSGLSEINAASVLDIEMAGTNVERVRQMAKRIKDKSGQYPLFLVGEKVRVAELMQDAELKRLVSRTFSRSMLGPQISTALSLVRDQELMKQSSSKSSLGGYIALSLIALLIIASVAGWYATKDNRADQNVGHTQAEQSASLGEAFINSNKSRALVLNDELFQPEALVLLTRARAALKQGYIVGPENVNALHFYRQALSVDPYGDTAERRKETVLSELKSEFEMALRQGKIGRSSSIIKVVSELDPLDVELNSMRLSLNAKFSDDQQSG